MVHSIQEQADRALETAEQELMIAYERKNPCLLLLTNTTFHWSLICYSLKFLKFDFPIN